MNPAEQFLLILLSLAIFLPLSYALLRLWSKAVAKSWFEEKKKYH